MQALLAAFPGLREVRAPLISGYAWLLVVWVLVRPDVDHRPSNEVLGTLYDLIQALGPVATTAAITVLAYLVGGAVQGPWLAMLRWFRRRFAPVEQLAQEAAEPQIQARVAASRRAQEDRYRELKEPSADAQREYEQLVADWTQKLEAAGKAVRATVRRSYDVPTYLMTSADQHALLLLAAVDQKKAESELRCTVALPLFVLSIVLSVTVSPILALGAVAAIVLFIQGLARENQWQAELREAMQLNWMTILGISGLDEAVADIQREADQWYRKHATAA